MKIFLSRRMVEAQDRSTIGLLFSRALTAPPGWGYGFITLIWWLEITLGISSGKENAK